MGIKKATPLYLTYSVIYYFTIFLPKVPLLFPAKKRECGIFVPDMMKNSTHLTGVTLTSPDQEVHCYTDKYACC